MSEARRSREEKRQELKTIRKGTSRRTKPSRKERERRAELAAVRGKETQPVTIVRKAEQSISNARKTIETAESYSQDFGKEIKWGDKTYDLGTTAGWKEYKQAIRDAKSKLKKHEGQVTRYKTSVRSAEVSRKANTVIKAANNVITRSNVLIKQSNETRKMLYEVRKKLIEQDLRLKHGFTKKSPGEYYGDQINETLIQLTDQINNDIKDPEKAKETLKAIAPMYFTTVKKEDQIEKLFETIEKKKRDAESRAEWDKVTGYYSGKRPTPAQLSARLEHLALSSSDSFIKTLPIATLAVAGGPLVAGFIGAASIATFVDPKTRYETAVFIGAHPEEFYASIAGSLAAGLSVAKAKQLWGRYSTQIKTSQLQKYNEKFDKLIDDYAYLEQQKGAEFPSRLTQAPGDEPYVLTRGPGEDAWTDFVLRKFMQGLSKDDMAKWLQEQKPTLLLDLENTGKLTPVPLEDLITKYPELKDPFIHPAFQDPNLLNRADLVARIPGSKIQMTPLLAAALARASKQGYLTDADLTELIKSNIGTLEEVKTFDLTVPWSAQDVKTIELTDALNLMGQIPEDITEVTPVQTTIQEPVQLTEPIEEVTPIEEPAPIIVPEPTPPTEPPPKTPRPLLTAKDREAMKRVRLQLFNGPISKYTAKFNYRRGKAQSVTVKARSFIEAMNKAQRKRQLTKRHPSSVELVRVR